MKRILLTALVILVWAGVTPAEEYAIIRESLFGTQKIEIYKTLDEALKNYSGEGALYQISRKKVPVKQVETRKKIEVTEYEWIVDMTDEKNGKPKGK